MMDDRELLELAAKAVGYAKFDWLAGDGVMNVYHADGLHEYWAPLADDGDALRLSVKLGIEVRPDREVEEVVTAFCVRKSCLIGLNTFEEFGDDEMAATRRAIVRAAAEIGRNMGKSQ